MLRFFLIVLLAVVTVVVPVAGQESSPPEQPEPAVSAEPAEPAEPVESVESVEPTACTVAISFGTGVDRETRTLVGAATQFTAEVGQVYCFTHLNGVDAPAVVTHAWYHAGNTMAIVDLKVGSAAWRTWSSKLVLPGWSGHWEVKVLDAAGKVLGSAGFELQ